MNDRKTVLWVEDDPYYKARLKPVLEIAGFRVLEALDARSAMNLICNRNERVDLVVLDVAMPHGGAFGDLASKAGHETGLLLAGWIHDRFPDITILGFSLNTSREVQDWFSACGHGYFRKGVEEWTMVNHIKRTLGMGHIRTKGPRIFIVHGHDEECVAQLRALLTQTLTSVEIVILKELPGWGRTMIEKFEQAAETVDVVFVLLTPDDVAVAGSAPDSHSSRARQNVIFELGYFYAKLQRSRGRVVVLCKGDVERPSDLAGIDYIDITDGVSTAADQIKRELADWL
jgi:CheY-like chemotaxis protein